MFSYFYYLRGATDTLFVILSHFFSFYPLPNNAENQQFDKLKIVTGDIIILHMYTINDNHVIGGSCDMECDGHNFLSCWTFFVFLPPSKPKTFKKMKKNPRGIIILHTCTKN